MKKLLPFLKPYTKESILGPLFKLLEAGLELFIPLVIADIIDIGIATGDKGYLYSHFALMIGLGFLGLICSITAQYFAAKASVMFSGAVRSRLFAHIETLSDKDVDTLGTSTLITRISGDINQIQSAMNLGLRLLLRSPFIVFGAMIMAFTIDVQSALIFAIVIPVLSVIVFFIILTTKSLYKKVQGRLDNVTKAARENLSGVRVIRAFRRENREKEEFGVLHEELTSLQLFVGKISALLNPLTFIVINCGLLVLVYVGAIRVDSGAITQGQVVALVNYMGQILVELVKLANLIITITKGLASADRVEIILEIKPSLVFNETSEKPANMTAPAAEFENVSFAYNEGGEEALTDISFSANAGDLIGIIGGTGSGKTTVISLLMRAYDAGKGVVKLFGNDIRTYSYADLKKMISVVPQKAVLFKGTVRDNLKVGREDATDEEMIKALKAAQSYDFLKEKDMLDTAVDEGGRNFSGGQRQRLSLARALVKNAPILILDDSFSALDYATDAALRKSLKEMYAGVTAFVVSQRASSILEADKILVLDDGEMVGLGKSKELLKTCDVYKEIYETQFGEED
ncbi:MAG: ABC transporter ATP-binding protein [Lachnospiraceae bacterium]|nr:ABC transporter ATP-binding protein [Lachnospiraceae bacterium]